MKRTTILGSLVVALALPTMALGHGGGLDSLGCHNDRKNGGYHCHRGSLAGRSFASPSEALQALQGQNSPPTAAPIADSPSAPAQRLLAAPPDVKTGENTPITPAELTVAVQNLLQLLGFSPGSPDGVAGYTTRAAILKFQMENGLDPDAQVSGALLVRLSETARVTCSQ